MDFITGSAIVSAWSAASVLFCLCALLVVACIISLGAKGFPFIATIAFWIWFYSGSSMTERGYSNWMEIGIVAMFVLNMAVLSAVVDSLDDNGRGSIGLAILCILYCFVFIMIAKHGVYRPEAVLDVQPCDGGCVMSDVFGQEPLHLETEGYVGSGPEPTRPLKVKQEPPNKVEGLDTEMYAKIQATGVVSARFEDGKVTVTSVYDPSLTLTTDAETLFNHRQQTTQYVCITETVEWPERLMYCRERCASSYTNADPFRFATCWELCRKITFSESF